VADDRLVGLDRYILGAAEDAHDGPPDPDDEERDDEPQGGDDDTDCRHCHGSELTGHEPDCIYSVLGSANQHAEVLEQYLDAARARIAALEAELRNVLASAVPHPREHPCMSAAWKRAEALLAKDPANG
jgi:hypothetical protein